LTHRILSLQLCEESKSTYQQGLTEGPKDWGGTWNKALTIQCQFVG